MNKGMPPETKTEKIVVSVIIPAYNAGKTLPKAVESALSQDVPLEILVVDDASEIPAMETLAPYWGEKRIRILRLSRNRGVAAARNRGIREAKGEYIAFLDADDWWAPGKLSAQLSAMEKSKSVLCCTARELMNADGSSRGKVISVPKKIRYQDLLKGNCINCSSALIRTEAVREFPMEHDDAHEDYILWLKILKKYGNAVGLQKPYLKYRMSRDSKSGSKWKSARMTYRVYRYMGYSRWKSLVCFIHYAVNGAKKYA